MYDTSIHELEKRWPGRLDVCTGIIDPNAAVRCRTRLGHNTGTIFYPAPATAAATAVWPWCVLCRAMYEHKRYDMIEPYWLFVRT